MCYLPKEKRSEAMRVKREKYLRERRTTSHWPYPVYVNGKQPRTYGNEDLLIDYSKMEPIDLSDMMEEIKELI